MSLILSKAPILDQESAAIAGIQVKRDLVHPRYPWTCIGHHVASIAIANSNT